MFRPLLFVSSVAVQASSHYADIAVLPIVAVGLAIAEGLVTLTDLIIRCCYRRRSHQIA
jgi:hypothetical protein